MDEEENLNEDPKTAKHFFDMCQCKELLDLMQIDTSIDILLESSTKVPFWRIQHGEIVMKLDCVKDEVKEFKFGPLEHRILVVIRELYAKCRDSEITASVQELMAKFKLRSMDDFRNQLAGCLKHLKIIQFKDKNGRWAHICYKADIHQGFVIIELTPKFEELLQSPGLIQMPYLYYDLKRNIHHNSPSLLHFIATSRFLSNKTPQRKDIISIKSLLAHTTLPSIEVVRQKEKDGKKRNGSIKERIITPFFNELHALDDELSFSYKSKYGDSLSEEQVKELRYEDFVKVKIKFTWVHEKEFRQYVPPKKEETKEKRSQKKESPKDDAA